MDKANIVRVENDNLMKEKVMLKRAPRCGQTLHCWRQIFPGTGGL